MRFWKPWNKVQKVFASPLATSGFVASTIWSASNYLIQEFAGDSLTDWQRHIISILPTVVIGTATFYHCYNYYYRSIYNIPSIDSVITNEAREIREALEILHPKLNSLYHLHQYGMKIDNNGKVIEDNFKQLDSQLLRLRSNYSNLARSLNSLSDNRHVSYNSALIPLQVVLSICDFNTLHSLVYAAYNFLSNNDKEHEIITVFSVTSAIFLPTVLYKIYCWNKQERYIRNIPEINNLIEQINQASKSVSDSTANLTLLVRSLFNSHSDSRIILNASNLLTLASSKPSPQMNWKSSLLNSVRHHKKKDIERIINNLFDTFIASDIQFHIQHSKEEFLTVQKNNIESFDNDFVVLGIGKKDQRIKHLNKTSLLTYALICFYSSGYFLDNFNLSFNVKISLQAVSSLLASIAQGVKTYIYHSHIEKNISDFQKLGDSLIELETVTRTLDELAVIFNTTFTNYKANLIHSLSRVKASTPQKNLWMQIKQASQKSQDEKVQRGDNVLKEFELNFQQTFFSRPEIKQVNEYTPLLNVGTNGYNV